MPSSVTVISALLILACTEPAEHLPCDVDLLQTELRFPDLAPGERATEHLQVYNEGGLTCVLTQPTVSGHLETLIEAGFEVAAWDTDTLLPGQVGTVEVDYRPTKPNTHKAQLYFSASTGLIYSVGLEGLAVGGTLELSTEEVDFGVVEVGCQSEHLLALANTGSTALVIQALTLRGGGSELGLQPELDRVKGPLPWSLEPGESVEVGLSYAPQDSYADSAWLSIQSDDPRAPETLVSLQGQASISQAQTDIFEQSQNPAAALELSHLPAASTLELQVDGVPSTQGWQYVLSTNTIDFELGSVPPAGSIIHVYYVVQGDCQ